MDRTREAEAKFSIPPDLRLPRRWDLAGVSVRPGKRSRLTTTYFDTPDLRLARWGASLRYRAGEGWTVKLPEDSPGELLVRAEHRFDGGPGDPPADAVDLVRAFVRKAQVHPVASLRTRRSSFSFMDRKDREVAELVDDRVSAEGPTVTVSAFREIEVEVRDDAPEGLVGTVAEQLVGAERQPRSKVVRALGPPAEGAPDVVTPRLDPDATAGEVIRGAMASSVLRLVWNDPGTRLGTDTESVHQCRVAVRRLRSDLRTFAPLLERGWTDDLRVELRWLGRSLGRVRDKDVLLEQLRQRSTELPEQAHRPAARLLRRLRTERHEHRRGLLDDLRQERYPALLDRLVEAAATPALLPSAEQGARGTLPPLAAEPWRRLSRFVAELGPHPTDKDLHQLRIRAKRARYAAEAVQVIEGRPVARFARAAAALQDALGVLQDAVVAFEWLQGAATRASGSVAFAASTLAAAVWQEAATARAGWPKAWKKLAKRAPEGWS